MGFCRLHLEENILRQHTGSVLLASLAKKLACDTRTARGNMGRLNMGSVGETVVGNLKALESAGWTSDVGVMPE